jgi:hypothetical protein
MAKLELRELKGWKSSHFWGYTTTPLGLCHGGSVGNRVIFEGILQPGLSTSPTRYFARTSIVGVNHYDKMQNRVDSKKVQKGIVHHKNLHFTFLNFSVDKSAHI